MKKTFTIYEEEKISNSFPVSIQKTRIRGKHFTLPTAGVACCTKTQLKDILEHEKKTNAEGFPDFDQVSLLELPLYVGNRLIREVKRLYKTHLSHRIIVFTPLTEYWYRKHYELQEMVSASNSGVGPTLQTLYLKTRIKSIKSHLKQKERVVALIDQLKYPGKLKLLDEGFSLQKEATWLLPVTPAIYDSGNSLTQSIELNSMCHDAVKLSYQGDVDYGFYFNFYSSALSKGDDVLRIRDAICDLIRYQIKLHPADELPSAIVFRIWNEHEIKNKIEHASSLKMLVESIMATIGRYDIMFHFSRTTRFGYASLFKGVHSYSYPINLRTTIKDSKSKGYIGHINMEEWPVYDPITKGTIKFGDMLSNSTYYNKIKKYQPYTDKLFGGRLELDKLIDNLNSNQFARYRNSGVLESLHNEIYQFISKFKNRKDREIFDEFIVEVNDPLIEEYLS